MSLSKKTTHLGSDTNEECACMLKINEGYFVYLSSIILQIIQDYPHTHTQN